MIVTLQFKLPDETDEYTATYNGPKHLSVIEDLDNFLRNRIKYHSDEITEEQLNVYRIVREELNRLRNEE